MSIHPVNKEKDRKALWRIVCMGQYNGVVRPSRAERKAARWAYRVLKQHGVAP